MDQRFPTLRIHTPPCSAQKSAQTCINKMESDYQKGTFFEAGVTLIASSGHAFRIKDSDVLAFASPLISDEGQNTALFKHLLGSATHTILYERESF